jgi:hypothetical protein
VTYTQGRAVTTALGRRYNPSVTLSLGLGWRRHRP